MVRSFFQNMVRYSDLTSVLAAAKAGKPVILEEFGVSGLQNKTDIYPEWVGLALETKHAFVVRMTLYTLKSLTVSTVGEEHGH